MYQPGKGGTFGNNNGNGHRPGKERASEPGGHFNNGKRLERLESEQGGEERLSIDSLIEQQRGLGGWAARTSADKKGREIG